MNRIFSIVALLCTLLLAGCTSSDYSNDDEAVFYATILEIHELSVLVQTIENMGFYHVTRVFFGTSELDDIGATVGDLVRVEYTGDIMQTYPEQVFATGWSLIESASPLRYQSSLLDYVEMVASLGVDPNSLVVTIYNNSAYELMTGEHFTIEFFDGIGWRDVPWRNEYIAFTDIGWSIQPNESMEFIKNLALFEPLEAEFYRVRKSVFRTTDTPIREGDLHDVVGHFPTFPNRAKVKQRLN